MCHYRGLVRKSNWPSKGWMTEQSLTHLYCIKRTYNNELLTKQVTSYVFPSKIQPYLESIQHCCCRNKTKYGVGRLNFTKLWILREQYGCENLQRRIFCQGSSKLFYRQTSTKRWHYIIFTFNVRRHNNVIRINFHWFKKTIVSNFCPNYKLKKWKKIAK